MIPTEGEEHVLPRLKTTLAHLHVKELKKWVLNNAEFEKLIFKIDILIIFEKCNFEKKEILHNVWIPQVLEFIYVNS